MVTAGAARNSGRCVRSGRSILGRPSPGVSLAGLGLGWGRSDAGHDVRRGDAEATVGRDLALGEVSGPGGPSRWSEVAVEPGGAIVVAGYGEAGERDVVCDRKAARGRRPAAGTRTARALSRRSSRTGAGTR